MPHKFIQAVSMNINPLGGCHVAQNGVYTSTLLQQQPRDTQENKLDRVLQDFFFVYNL